MIADYKARLQQELTEALARERGAVIAHTQAVARKQAEVAEVRLGVEDVAAELRALRENEEEYLRLQKEKFRRVQLELDGDEAEGSCEKIKVQQD